MKIYVRSVFGLSAILSVTSFHVNHPKGKTIRLHAVAAPPSLAQTHMQGPLSIAGSGKPLTKQELEDVRVKLEALKQEFGYKEPNRMFMDDVEPSNWRFGGKPDYSLTNYLYLQQRTRQQKSRQDVGNGTVPQTRSIHTRIRRQAKISNFGKRWQDL
jgi:hypothetical protein